MPVYDECESTSLTLADADNAIKVLYDKLADLLSLTTEQAETMQSLMKITFEPVVLDELYGCLENYFDGIIES